MGCSIFGDDKGGDDDDDGGDGGDSGESTGGTTAKGGSSNGGTNTNGGSSGGSVSKGGSSNGGGTNGGSTSLGGTLSNGGTGGGLPLGGTGGDLSVGGTVSSGGTGGDISQGGSLSNGGTSGTSGTSGTGGGDPPSGSCGDAFNVELGGYVTSPGATCWHGYAFTVIDTLGSTITPETFGDCASPSCLCVSGTVIGDADYLGYATFGFNINQDPTVDATEGTVVPTGSGLTISYTNTGGSGLRVQIGSGSTRWCYDNLTGSGGTVTIPYSSFNTECWEGGDGDPYLGEAISSVQLVIPGSTTALTYGACLVSATDG